LCHVHATIIRDCAPGSTRPAVTTVDDALTG